MDLFYGIMVSQCLPPCLRTTATVEKKMTGNLFTEDNLTMININFDENVRVTKTSVDQFSFLKSLNFLGSNLGLWPGLGLYQILEWMAGMVIVTQAFVRCRGFKFGANK